MTTTSPEAFVLKLSCPNRPGIVAAISAAVFEGGFNILESHQYDDIESNTFFMRVVFNAATSEADGTALHAAVAAIAMRFSMRWSLRDRAKRSRVAIFVSKYHHCLADLLYRWRIDELPIDIVAIVANHPMETYADLDFSGIPFHYLPIVADDKADQEAKIWSVIESAQTDLVVLARYMQILGDDLTAKLSGRCINIHHSFLPGFKGARPYDRAHARGVKLVGATAHYVTKDLDEGPIIEQDVGRISHSDTTEILIRKGRDIERRVLSQAVRLHIEDRIILNGKKTVVFGD